MIALCAWPALATAEPASVLTAKVTAISVESYASNGVQPTRTVDLVDHVTLENQGGRLVSHRKLDDAELAPLLAALRAIPETFAPRPGQGGPPGGSTHWVLHDKDGTTRILAEAGGAPSGVRFIAITRAQADALGAAWPDPRGVPRPPTIEQKIKQFLVEALVGPPGGPRDLDGSLARVDPDHTLFTLEHHPRSNGEVSLQLRLKPGVVADAERLAHELDLAEPIAFLPGDFTGNPAWVLGDKRTGQPIQTWRGATLGVGLFTDARPHSTADHVAPIHGARVENIVMLLPK
ncbi:MAG TPA: hypothetical protein VH165_14905 [Kofleriaceae bacterium]|nr:hypothetical protein [Kofleriaceae bacterium]